MTTMMRASFVGLICLLFACGGGSGDDGDDVADDTADDGDDGDDGAGVCGDGTTDAGEECDDGNTEAGDGCDDACQDEPATAARMTSLELVDPHLYADIGIEYDVTSYANDAITSGITEDADDPADGILDLSFVLLFRPWSLDAASASVDQVIGADCAAPDGTSCTSNAEATVVETVVTNTDSGCLTPVDDTTSNDVDVPVGRCFTTDKHTLSLSLGTLELQLEATQLGGTYSTSGVTVTHGLMMGFISEASADATTIPEDVDLVGGEPLSSILRDDDMDTGPSGETGWWFYLNFTASEVAYTE